MANEVRARIATGVVLAAAAAIVAVVVFGVPGRAVFTFAAVLICPLSMLFMHGGHAGHGAGGAEAGHHAHDHAREASADDADRSN